MTSHTKPPKIFYYLILFIFFLSGFSGLIYESIWSRYLGLLLGHAAYAQTLVIILFMGGMGAGAWLVSRYTHRLTNLFLIYALIECIIGFCGITFHYLYTGGTEFMYHSVLPTLDSPFSISLVKWITAAALIVPQTILLGATFPLMAGGFLRYFNLREGKSLSLLYFVNSIGAALGILIGGFFLVDHLGLPGTIFTAGCINFFIALIVFLVVLKSRSFTNTNQQVAVIPEIEKNPENNALFRVLMVCSCLTGVASFIYEIGWIRMLSMVLGSSTHSFELMLSTFILGIAIGSLCIKSKIDSLQSPLRTLALIQLVMGFFASFSILAYGNMFDIMSFFIQSLATTESGYYLFNFFCYVLAAVFMLPATICAGMTLPLITKMLFTTKQFGESAIGKVYAINTLGSVVGVILAVQLLMPLFGLKVLILCGAIVDILLALFLMKYVVGTNYKTINKIFYAIGSCSVLLVLFLFSSYELDSSKMSSGVFRHGALSGDKESIFHKDGKTASIDVYTFDNILTLATNGKPDASITLKHDQGISDDITEVLLGAIPLAIKGDIKTAAVIGMGSGVTSHVLLHDSNIQSLEVIEIEDAIIDAAKLFGPRSSNNFTDNRCEIHIEDAKTFFVNQQKKYDLIFSEPSNPWVSGVSSLFSKEFYQLTKQHLTEKGVFAQWLQLYEINDELVVSVLKALSSAFPHYDIFFAGKGNLLIIAKLTNEPLNYSENLFSSSGLVKELAGIGVDSIECFKYYHIGSNKLFNPLISTYQVEANSDYYPILDSGAVKSRFTKNSSVESFSQLQRTSFPIQRILFNQHYDSAKLGKAPAGKSVEGNLRSAYEAQLIYESFFPAKTINGVLLIDLRKDIKVVLESTFAAGDYQFSQSWLHSYKTIMDKCVPYLSKRQLSKMNLKIIIRGVHLNLSKDQGTWISLYSAIIREDMSKIGMLTKQMLGKRNSPDDQRYLIVANAVANLKMNNYHHAKQVLKLGEAYFQEKNQLTFRLLKGLCNHYNSANSNP